LTRAFEFREVRSRGKSYPGRFLVLGVLEKDSLDVPPRVGIIASRRVGGAVRRNRVRRRLREIFRLHQFQIRRGVWLVMVARQKAASASFEAIEREWLLLADRASILAGQ
jgi:ribonuclease P protein component